MSVSRYAQHVAPKKKQVESDAHTYAADRWTLLDRFLILGCLGGTYTAGEEEMSKAAANCVLDCAKLDSERTVNRIVQISEQGRAPKNDPAIFALALLASSGMKTDRAEIASRLAMEAMPQVCRTSTHMFQFVEAVDQLRGWGRSLRKAVANWYLSKDADALAYQVTKYPQRDGWSHRDVLRLSHPVPRNAGHKDVFQYITQREKWFASSKPGTRMLVMAEEAKTASVKKLCKLIRDEGLVREHIPTEHLNSPEIWEALLEDMPVMAMIRNLNKLTEIGVLAPLSSGTKHVCEFLRAPGILKKARLHPFNILVALKTYASGRGFRVDKTWKPVPQVVAALEDAFYLAFDAVEPTGKRYLFGIDVSGSMRTSIINETNVSCRSAAACLAMVGLRTEEQSYAFGFAHDFVDLGMTASDRLAEAEQKAWRARFGATNCALPIEYALKHRMEVDAFVIITDNETNTGPSPSAALQYYREKTGIDARLVAIGMTANGVTIADPRDAGMLNVVGFDTAAPSIVADFVRDSGVSRYRQCA